MPAAPSQRILVRGVNWLGDAVMTTPALQRLREARPEDHITLLTHVKLEELWRGHPAINAVETFAAGESVWSVARRLRDGKFDRGLIFPNSFRSALELWLARIPQQVGVTRPGRDWVVATALAQHLNAVPMRKRSKSEINRLIRGGVVPPRPPARAHHIFQYLCLAAVLGANPEPLPPRLVVTADARARFIAKFKLNAEPPGVGWFGLNAGAEYGPAKRWPEQRFIDAAVRIQRETACGWMIFGGPAETELAARIASGIRQGARGGAGPNLGLLNLAGATTLGELCAGLQFCRVLLTNDSGPMHVAAALGAKVVAPFGSTSPELTGPGLPGDSRHELLRANAPCSPCFLRECPIDFRCMTGISVEQVVTAVLRAAA